jgi:hypothetical protein
MDGKANLNDRLEEFRVYQAARQLFEPFARLLPAEVFDQRVAALNQIIGGLTQTIQTAERKLTAKR